MIHFDNRYIIGIYYQKDYLMDEIHPSSAFKATAESTVKEYFTEFEDFFLDSCDKYLTHPAMVSLEVNRIFKTSKGNYIRLQIQNHPFDD